MIEPTPWNGKDLTGTWLFSRKKDGVRMLRDENGKPVSRRNKPLYNLERIPASLTDCEICINDDWGISMSAVRTQDGTPVDPQHAYSIDPLDPRLFLGVVKTPSAVYINQKLTEALARGEEGLVLYRIEVLTETKTDECLKVKPKETYEVLVTGATEGKGKYLGLIGALITPKGKVSGMSDAQREAFTQTLPKVIEVECQGLTVHGKFRHPRFLRERFDKEADQ